MDELKDIKRKKLSSWDVMSSILKKQITPTKEEIQTLNSFFFCRYTCSNRHSVPIAAVLNRFYNIPIETQYRFAKDYSDLVQLPRLVKFINYRAPKTSKDLLAWYELLEKHYKISRTTAELYFEMMSNNPEGQEKLKEIAQLYEHGLTK